MGFGAGLCHWCIPRRESGDAQCGACWEFHSDRRGCIRINRSIYGREKLLYQKANQQGVQVSIAAAGGPTFGLITPYYVLSGDQQYSQFDLVRHPNPQSIAGPGKLFQGLGESEFAPGLHAKGSIFFEFGTYRSNVAGVELGVMAEGFTKEIILVPTQPNKSLFTSVFFTLFWGSRK